jgi:hypothetical protein
MLEEDYTSSDMKICNNLFQLPIDIEHIQSYHDSNGDKRDDIWNEWGDDINSIGNLMILEQDINRSISNNTYDIKINRYPNSSFSIVKNQPIQYAYWDLEKCIFRKQKETKKILRYLFN